MFVVFVLAAAAVLFAVVMVALGRGGLLDPDVSPAGEQLLPEGEVSTDDVEELRFTVAYRGYRMDQVDAVMDRLQDELTTRDERIGELEARISQAGPARRSGSPLPRRQPGSPQPTPSREPHQPTSE